ncbi:hypothetical protein [Tenacibaculum amylolyticum]|uniref:hypothetical protein n=1 Tax=Tenacibaculum amylolyticum TaxID=104269 RepID=UPI003895FCA4
MDILSEKLLSYGISGFALIMIVLTYRLLQAELKREAPRPIATKTIGMFMGLVLIATVVVGFFSVPIANKNDQLSTEVNDLTINISKLLQMLTKYETTINKLSYKIEKLQGKTPPKNPPKVNGTFVLDANILKKHVDFSKIQPAKKYQIQNLNETLRKEIKKDALRKLDQSPKR